MRQSEHPLLYYPIPSTKILLRPLLAVLASTLVAFAADTLLRHHAPAAPTDTAPAGRGGRGEPVIRLRRRRQRLRPRARFPGASGVPPGGVGQIRLGQSEIYPLPSAIIWVYIPAQYDPKVPAALMVIQDGVRQYTAREATDDNRAHRRTPEYCTPTVLDNLIAPENCR